MIELSNKNDLTDITYDNDEYNEDYEDYEEYDNNENEKNNKNINDELNFIEECEIIKERENDISLAQEKLFLKREDAILALILYEWNMDILDNWYENIEENKIKAGIKLSEDIRKKLANNGINTNGDFCLICEEKKNSTFFSLNCGHQFCEYCWTEYLKEKIKSPLNALKVKCPQMGCTCIVYENLYSKFLKNNNSIKKINIAIYQNFINKNDDIKKCPNENCDLFIKSNKHYEREIICLCGTSFCYKCLHFSHFPCPCDIIQKWCELIKKHYHISSDEKLNEKWIKAYTKECPNCHQKIEKNEGCNYMLCDPKAGGCGQAFCYVCGIDWKKHINDHFYCNNNNTQEVLKKEMYLQNLKTELEIDLIEKQFFEQDKNMFKNDKLSFYYDKYVICENYINSCITLKKSIEEKKSVLNAIHYINLFDLNFLDIAIETIVNSKKILKMSYIFAYFMKDGINKNLFVNARELLQYNTDSLYNKLSDNQLNNLINKDTLNFTSLINKYKTSIYISIYTINNSIKKFTEDFENKYILDLDDELII